MSGLSGSISTAVIAGLSAILGTFVGGWLKNDGELKLEQQKFYSEIILKSLESDDPKYRRDTLYILGKTKILSDEDLRLSIMDYVREVDEKKEEVPQVRVDSLSPPAPVVPNNRIFLLSSRESPNGNLLNEYAEILGRQGYNVIGNKAIYDSTRPSTPEVRYFNDSDLAQATAIRDFVALRQKATEVGLSRLEDSSARPGYIELWLGR